MNELNKLVGERIAQIRKYNRINQSDLADKLGVTYQAVSKWENGKNIPDIMILKQKRICPLKIHRGLIIHILCRNKHGKEN